MGEQEEQMEDRDELGQVRRQALKVQAKGALGGLVLTGIAFLISW